MAVAARTPMIATTMSNSISVNPRCEFMFQDAHFLEAVAVPATRHPCSHRSPRSVAWSRRPCLTVLHDVGPIAFHLLITRHAVRCDGGDDRCALAAETGAHGNDNWLP